MNFLDINALPRFQERLDLAASDLNQLEEIMCKSLNELAGRIYIMANLIPQDERSKYAEEINCAILNEIGRLNDNITELNAKIDAIRDMHESELETLRNNYEELDARLVALDDAAARKEDLNALWYRTGDIE